jgi:hypothetical protein
MKALKELFNWGGRAAGQQFDGHLPDYHNLIVPYLSRAGAGNQTTLEELLGVLAKAGVPEEDRLSVLAQLTESGQIVEEDDPEAGIVYSLP